VSVILLAFARLFIFQTIRFMHVVKHVIPVAMNLDITIVSSIIVCFVTFCIYNNMFM